MTSCNSTGVAASYSPIVLARVNWYKVDIRWWISIENIDTLPSGIQGVQGAALGNHFFRIYTTFLLIDGALHVTNEVHAWFHRFSNVCVCVCVWALWRNHTIGPVQPYAIWVKAPSASAWNNNATAINQAYTVYPKKYAHGFVVLCFVVVMQSFIMNSHDAFIHIHQGCFAGTGAIVRLPQCQWSKPNGYGKISQCITTTKHSKAKTVCIFLGICCNMIIYISYSYGM